MHTDDGEWYSLNYMCRTCNEQFAIELYNCQKFQLKHILFFIEPLHNASPGDQFQWLPKEHMCVLVYLVSGLSFMYVFINIHSPWLLFKWQFKDTYMSYFQLHVVVEQILFSLVM